MSRKRRNTSSPEADSPPASKRHNRDYEAPEWDSADEEESKEKPQLDEYTGQAGAFPGLGKDSDDLFYGPASDGIDYLRMVRSEARGVPHILTVPSTQSVGFQKHTVSVQGNGGGVYYDGTYTALADPSTEQGETPPDAQEFYYDALLKQFRVVQATMRCTPPLAVLESLASSRLISFPGDSRQARVQWEALVSTVDPHPAQIAVMDPKSVLELVTLLRKKLNIYFSSRDEGTVSRVGAWLWATLGKCRDRGELSSEEIGELRLLAQRAIDIQARFDMDSNQHTSNSDLGSLENDIDDGDSEDEQHRSERTLPADEKGTFSARQAGSVEEELGKATERDRLIAAALDMVITVVGEIYGQRDLLGSRRKWEESRILT
ncbi:uncharacterized protein A1O9_11180 [Exophiala aquamarina CBS 119918]|uniref:Uncharacterized protein n=1 Tax=Exophiala aquamarina CBS 119918 TaxID=1182545 RepID=A0A072P0L2_9EURO|nr:uncharacterized protein A1O9_11180 [Exophiala aquamarina CBS 119918]KEF52763.1 hypothetical protein A1O9_11180 [Exophiala aquamarina CBS 119918]